MVVKNDLHVPIIRPADFPADCATIAAIAVPAWYATFSGTHSQEFIAHELAREYSSEGLAQQVDAGHQFVLLLLNRQPIGFAAFQHLPREKTTKLHKLYVLPESKRLGYGSRLINHVAQEAMAVDSRQIALQVARDNPAIAFYRKHGYEIASEMDICVGENFWRYDYLMRKSLFNSEPG